MAKKELLAPAGDIEAGYAALYYGADAVYLGLKQFSARATANNFDAQELNEFTGYVHSLGRKVFVTINTVLQESELADLIKNLDICRAAKVDALIVQDLGVARIVKKYYPEIALHASTQMAVHNAAGALALQKQGFSRVVLARELTKNEIEKIAQTVDIELEGFVHGALCYSYSGVCQFSSVAEGRSANRGKCLYPCRAEFIKDGKKGHWFSMKDLALQEDVLQMPVYSLKIEGRKKNALYVAAVVDYYRRILDGKGSDKKRADNIKQIFSRPWCKFHFKGKDKTVVDREFVGHRGLEIGQIENIKNDIITLKPKHQIARHDGLQIEVKGEEKPVGFSLQNFKVAGKSVFEVKVGETAEIKLPPLKVKLQKGDKVYLASSSIVKGSYDYTKPKPKEFWQKESIDVTVKIEQKRILAKSGDYSSELLVALDEAKDVIKVNEAVEKAFAKTGDVEFNLGKLEIENTKGYFVPASMLNDLRRDLYAKVKITKEKVAIETVQPRKLPSDSKWAVKIDNKYYLADLPLNEIDEVIYLLNENSTIADLPRLGRDKLRLALPVICRNEVKMRRLIDELLKQGYKKWEISNYWGLGVLPIQDVDLSFDNMIYCFNTQAIAQAKEMGAKRVSLAIEDTYDNWLVLAEKSPLPVCAVVYQDVPLFISAVCIRDNDCKGCNQKLQWSNLSLKGQEYLARNENCQTIVFKKDAFAAVVAAEKLEVDWLRADFCYREYSAQQVAEIVAQIKGGKNPPLTHKANLEIKPNVF